MTQANSDRFDVYILFFSAKFLVTSGIGQNNKRKPFPFEVIDLAIPNAKCELALDVEDFPKRPGSVAALIQDKIVLCGGSSKRQGSALSGFELECRVIGQEGSAMELLERRYESCSVKIGMFLNVKNHVFFVISRHIL